MKELIADRAWKKRTYTISRLFLGEERLCEILEDPDRGLDQRMPLSQIERMKVRKETAIPRGTYEVRLSVSEKYKTRPWAKKYKGLVPEILGVKGFSGVRIHPANTADQIEGCLAPGRNKVVGKVIESTDCYYELMDKIFIPAHQAKEQVTLTIL